MSRVGEKIKEISEKKGISKKVLAKKLGVSESFLIEVETGRRVIPEDLLKRLTKVLGDEINDISASFEETYIKEDVKEVPKYNVKQEAPKDIWKDAFGDVLMKVPVYNMSFTETLGSRLMPIENNRVEGYSKDKVIFIKIEDEDMIGNRMHPGDLALAVMNQEVINNSICLLEYNNERIIRQIKKLDNTKLLLMSNKNSVKTTTALNNEVKIIARLLKLEISLS